MRVSNISILFLSLFFIFQSVIGALYGNNELMYFGFLGAITLFVGLLISPGDDALHAVGETGGKDEKKN